MPDVQDPSAEADRILSSITAPGLRAAAGQDTAALPDFHPAMAKVVAAGGWPGWTDTAVPAAERVRSFVDVNLKAGRSWDQAAGDAPARLGIDPAAVEPEFKMEEARRKAAGEEEPLLLAAIRKVPGSGTAAKFLLEREYGRARERVAAGQARTRPANWLGREFGAKEVSDYDLVAQYERLNQIKRDQSTGGALLDTATDLPAFLAETVAGGNLVRGGRALAAGGRLTRAGVEATPQFLAGEATRSLGARAAEVVGRTAATPAFYLEQGARNLNEAPKDRGELENLARSYGAAFVYGVAQNAIVGQLLKPATGSRAGAVAKKTPLGMVEQQAVDALAGATNLQTKYGLVSEFLDTDGHPLRHAATQALTFAVFAGIHGKPVDPQLEQFRKAVDALAGTDMSAADAARTIGTVQDRVRSAVEANPQITREQARTLFQDDPPGPVLDYALRLTADLPEGPRRAHGAAPPDEPIREGQPVNNDRLTPQKPLENQGSADPLAHWSDADVWDAATKLGVLKSKGKVDRKAALDALAAAGIDVGAAGEASGGRPTARPTTAEGPGGGIPHPTPRERVDAVTAERDRSDGRVAAAERSERAARERAGVLNAPADAKAAHTAARKELAAARRERKDIQTRLDAARDEAVKAEATGGKPAQPARPEPAPESPPEAAQAVPGPAGAPEPSATTGRPPTPTGEPQKLPDWLGKLPDWLRETIDNGYRSAERVGAVDLIRTRAAEGKVAKQIAAEIAPRLKAAGLDPNDAGTVVKAVRAKLGIPSQDDPAEFARWRASQQPAPAERRSSSRPPQGLWEQTRAEHPDWTTERVGQEMARQLEEARKDPQTGLWGKWQFFRDAETGEHGPHASLYDIPGLGAVNKFGDQAGDALIAAYGHAMGRAGIERGYRKGGDELAAFFKDPAEQKAAGDRLEKVLEGMEVEWQDANGRRVVMRGGLGVARAEGATLHEAQSRLNPAKESASERGFRAKEGGKVLPPRLRVEVEAGGPQEGRQAVRPGQADNPVPGRQDVLGPGHAAGGGPAGSAEHAGPGAYVSPGQSAAERAGLTRRPYTPGEEIPGGRRVSAVPRGLVREEARRVAALAADPVSRQEAAKTAAFEARERSLRQNPPVMDPATSLRVARLATAIRAALKQKGLRYKPGVLEGKAREVLSNYGEADFHEWLAYHEEKVGLRPVDDVEPTPENLDRLGREAARLEREIGDEERRGRRGEAGGGEAAVRRPADEPLRQADQAAADQAADQANAPGAARPARPGAGEVPGAEPEAGGRGDEPPAAGGGAAAGDRVDPDLPTRRPRKGETRIGRVGDVVHYDPAGHDLAPGGGTKTRAKVVRAGIRDAAGNVLRKPLVRRQAYQDEQAAFEAVRAREEEAAYHEEQAARLDRGEVDEAGKEIGPGEENDSFDFGRPLTPGERGGLPGGGQPGAGEAARRPVNETALANARVDAERARDNLPPLMAAARRANPEVWDRAMDRLAREPDAAAELVDELLKNPRATTVDENALLLQRRIAVRNEHERAARRAVALWPEARRTKDFAAFEEANRRAEDLDRERNRVDEVTRATGTEWGRAGQFRRQLAREDMSLSTLLGRAAVAARRPLTPQETVEVVMAADAVQAADKALADAEGPNAGASGVDPADLRVATRKARVRVEDVIGGLRYGSLSRTQKVVAGAREGLNASRSLITSLDFSAVLRQGGFLSLGHPVRALKALPGMFRAFASRRDFDRQQDALDQRPNAELYKRSGLYLADVDGRPSAQEEAFVGRIARRVPGVAASERAYVSFLNRLRADTFDSMAAGLSRGGRPTAKEAQAVAGFVNVATGRGGLGPLEKAAEPLAAVFFSPRYVASRFQILAGQPLYGGSAATRKLVAAEYARFLAGVGVFTALALAADDKAKLTLDPRSSDFGKIRVGNTRIDPLTGLGQSGVFVAKVAGGERAGVGDRSGKVTDIRGKVPYGGQTVQDVAANFVRGKLAPVPGVLADVAVGKSVTGEKVTAKREAGQLLVPMAGRDVKEALEDQGVPRGAAAGLLAVFGMGAQTFQPNKK